jgi:hypothetical protein
LLPVLAGLALPLDVLAQPRTSWRPGLQLYTVREALAADVEGTLRRVADTGYREVELAGLPGITARTMRAGLQRYGLDAPSMHASYARLRGDAASILEEARTLGARYLVCPSVDAGERGTADDWKRVCRVWITPLIFLRGNTMPMRERPTIRERALSCVRALNTLRAPIRQTKGLTNGASSRP